MESVSEPKFIYLKDVQHGMKNLNVIFIVLEIDAPKRTKDNHYVRTVKVADKTGMMDVSVWDEAGESIRHGDICKFLKGYSSMWNNALTLYSGKSGEIWKIGEFMMLFSESPNLSELKGEQYANSVNKDTNSKAQHKDQTDGGGGESGDRHPPPVQHQGPATGISRGSSLIQTAPAQTPLTHVGTRPPQHPATPFSRPRR